MFSKNDLRLFKAKGISLGAVEEQLGHFRNGFPFIQLDSPATAGNGIIQLSEQEVEKYARLYEKRLDRIDVVKFVPASGAATRMFKELFTYSEKSEGLEDEGNLLGTFPNLVDLLGDIDRLPFINDLKEELGAAGQIPDEMVMQNRAREIVKKILFTPGLGYGELPKGLISFHTYPDRSRTAFEEHLVEGAQYATTVNSEVRLHFTVSPEHIGLFKDKLEEVRGIYEAIFHVKYRIEFSIQQPSTDTIAVDMNNHPFRDEDGHIVFRPGGHGALLENLNSLEEDLVFIKNIDNVAPDRLKGVAIRYKKALAGLLIDFQDRVFRALRDLKGDIPGKRLEEICELVGSNLCKMEKRVETSSVERLKSDLKVILDRPIRIAGMVRNEGEPGGGPFWVRQTDGRIDLQIVEASQISPDQAGLLKQSTHFNPVDLVCAVKDFNGNSFDLLKFRDPKTGFITEKSVSGKPIRAQELPGLWNGSMAGWNTLFVEVPIDTFTPVKTIYDLLREEHQP